MWQNTGMDTIEWNFHILFVHFPIALLFVYSLLECLAAKRERERPHWFFIRASFVIVGMLSAHLASALGGAIEENVIRLHPELRSLVEAHSGIATLVTLVYTVVGLSYLVAWWEKERPERFSRANAHGAMLRLAKRWATRVLSPRIVVSLAVLGAIGIIVVVSLGTSIAHGAGTDPITASVVSAITGQ